MSEGTRLIRVVVGKFCAEVLLALVWPRAAALSRRLASMMHRSDAQSGIVFSQSLFSCNPLRFQRAWSSRNTVALTVTATRPASAAGEHSAASTCHSSTPTATTQQHSGHHSCHPPSLVIHEQRSAAPLPHCPPTQRPTNAASRDNALPPAAATAGHSHPRARHTSWPTGAAPRLPRQDPNTDRRHHSAVRCTKAHNPGSLLC
jgi:hypothetical protein